MEGCKNRKNRGWGEGGGGEGAWIIMLLAVAMVLGHYPALIG